MTRKFFFILLLLSAGNLAVAQTPVRNSIKAGISFIRFGSGDISGFNYYNEYNRSLNRFLTFAPSLHVGFGSKSGAHFRATKASVSIDPNLFFSPMRFDRSKLRLGVGPSLRFLADSHLTGYNVYSRESLPALPSELDYVIGNSRYNRPLNYWTVGYTLVVEGELNLNSRWNTGVRASFQNYVSGETAANLGVSMGYRF